MNTLPSQPRSPTCQHHHGQLPSVPGVDTLNPLDIQLFQQLMARPVQQDKDEDEDEQQ